MRVQRGNLLAVARNAGDILASEAVAVTVYAAGVEQQEILDWGPKVLLKDGLAAEGDTMVLLMGVPTHRMGPPNLMMVHNVGEWISLD